MTTHCKCQPCTCAPPCNCTSLCDCTSASLSANAAGDCACGCISTAGRADTEAQPN